jgi:hypothetical protein
MIDLWCRDYRCPPATITLDSDDTVDVVHGQHQLSLFYAHSDERCFRPIHVYDADSGHCVAALLRPGKTPSGDVQLVCEFQEAHHHFLVVGEATAPLGDG